MLNLEICKHLPAGEVHFMPVLPRIGRFFRNIHILGKLHHPRKHTIIRWGDIGLLAKLTSFISRSITNRLRRFRHEKLIFHLRCISQRVGGYAYLRVLGCGTSALVVITKHLINPMYAHGTGKPIASHFPSFSDITHLSPLSEEVPSIYNIAKDQLETLTRHGDGW